MNGHGDFLRDESGQSLPAQLVALAITAAAAAMLLMGMAVGSMGVTENHAQVFASGLAASQLELIADAPYASDPIASPYPDASAVPGYTVNVSVEYWIAPDGPFTSTWRDDGLQLVTVTASGPRGQILTLQSYKVDR
jgi:hypothetical protein